MNADDADLLRRYAAGSEPAFTALVHRHVDLVYHAALRRTHGDAHLAADIAQQVFTALARDAAKLSRHAVLSAWLHAATRNAALNAVISAQRRQAREHAAATLAVHDAPALDSEWQRLRPVLDAALDELSEPDRAVVILRHLEHRPFAQVAAALRVTEDAARLRTDRALEKLRVALARRGITSTAAALGAVVSAQPLVSAPAGLAPTLAHTALAAGATTALVPFLAALMTPKIITTALVTGAVAFAAGGYLGLNHASHAPLPPAPELPQHTQTIASLRQQVAQLKADRAQFEAANAKLAVDLRDARSRSAASTPKPAVLPSTSPEAAAIERAILNNLRQLAAAIDQFYLENKRPPTSLAEIVGENNYIKRLVPVAGETYAGLSMLTGQVMTVTTSSGQTVVYHH